MVLIKTNAGSATGTASVCFRDQVEKKHTLPILSNVLLEKKGDQLTLLATDIRTRSQRRPSLLSVTTTVRSPSVLKAAGHSAFAAGRRRSLVEP